MRSYGTGVLDSVVAVGSSPRLTRGDRWSDGAARAAPSPELDGRSGGKATTRAAKARVSRAAAALMRAPPAIAATHRRRRPATARGSTRLDRAQPRTRRTREARVHGTRKTDPAAHPGGARRQQHPFACADRPEIRHALRPPDSPRSAPRTSPPRLRRFSCCGDVPSSSASNAPRERNRGEAGGDRRRGTNGAALRPTALRPGAASLQETGCGCQHLRDALGSPRAWACGLLGREPECDLARDAIRRDTASAPAMRIAVRHVLFQHRPSPHRPHAQPAHSGPCEALRAAAV